MSRPLNAFRRGVPVIRLEPTRLSVIGVLYTENIIVYRPWKAATAENDTVLFDKSKTADCYL